MDDIRRERPKLVLEFDSHSDRAAFCQKLRRHKWAKRIGRVGGQRALGWLPKYARLHCVRSHG